MPSLASTVSLGFGSWGGLSDTITLGFGFGEVPETPIGSIAIEAIECRPRISVLGASVPSIRVQDVVISDSGIGIDAIGIK